jgi:uncharacterized membrane protein YgdD (TMEM256/DUF423 family)
MSSNIAFFQSSASIFMRRYMMVFASVLGVLDFSAFLAHQFKRKCRRPEVYETAVRYQFYHVFALLTAEFYIKNSSSDIAGGICFIAGILLLVVRYSRYPC